MSSILYNSIVEHLEYAYENSPAECVAMLSSTPRHILIDMPQGYKDNLYTPLKRYIDILSGSETVYTDIEDEPEDNIHQYAYLRIMDFESCLKYYKDHGFLLAKGILPYLPTAVMILRLPASFILTHNTSGDYAPCATEAWIKFLVEHNLNDHLGKHEKKRHIPEITNDLDSVKEWLSNIHPESEEMLYILTWIKHSQDEKAEYLQSFIPQLQQNIIDRFRHIPCRVRFAKVIAN